MRLELLPRDVAGATVAARTALAAVAAGQRDLDLDQVAAKVAAGVTAGSAVATNAPLFSAAARILCDALMVIPQGFSTITLMPFFRQGMAAV